MKRFNNKTILITGGTSGIGLAGAKRLLEEGAKVIITGRTESHLFEAKEQLGNNVIIVENDVEKEDFLTDLLSVVKKSGKIDGLWLNAAFAAGGDLNTLDKNSIDKMFHVNVVAPMLQMGALSLFINNGGAVVVTSSSAVYEGQSSISLYSATKAAILSAAKSCAAELSPRGIRVNSIIPGPIKSNLRSSLPDDLRQQFEEELAKTLLLKRIGEPEEAAAIALFLLSDDSSYVTGSEYIVDGGLLMK